jgi:hypothetical protein
MQVPELALARTLAADAEQELLAGRFPDLEALRAAATTW